MAEFAQYAMAAAEEALQDAGRMSMSASERERTVRPLLPLTILSRTLPPALAYSSPHTP